jgi:low affinity Fe/Cu permease
VTLREVFHRLAHATASAIGSPYAFASALLVIVAWAACGPAFHYSDTWQLVINTGTTIVTFLVVFMIQNTQNRDSRAIHLKLDELIRALDAARNRLVDVEDLPDEELARLASEFQRLRDQPEPTSPTPSTEQAPRTREAASTQAPSTAQKPGARKSSTAPKPGGRPPGTARR